MRYECKECGNDIFFLEVMPSTEYYDDLTVCRIKCTNCVMSLRNGMYENVCVDCIECKEIHIDCDHNTIGVVTTEENKWKDT